MLKRFLEKAISSSVPVPAYKIVDFMAKYDGTFVRLNCFSSLYDEWEPRVKKFKENILRDTPNFSIFDKLPFSVWNYKGDEFNCLIFSFDLINGRYSTVISRNVPFLTILQIGQNIYVSKFGNTTDIISINNIKNIINTGVESELFPSNYKVHSLTYDIIEKPFNFSTRSRQLVYRLSIEETKKTNKFNTGLGESTIWKNGKPSGIAFNIQTPPFELLIKEAKIKTWEMDDYGDIFISGDYFVYTSFGEELINESTYYMPSISIYKYDDILVSELFDLYFNSHIIGEYNSNESYYYYCHHYITPDLRTIANLPQKFEDKMKSFLEKRLQNEIDKNIDIDYVIKNIKEQLTSLQNFKLRNQDLLMEALSKYQKIEVV
jgi:hypothetical protein